MSDDGEGGLVGTSKKRARLVLACSACRRRKIKCDRTIPCAACVERGEAAGCEPENARRDTEMRDVLRRLSRLEAVIEKAGLDDPDGPQQRPLAAAQHPRALEAPHHPVALPPATADGRHVHDHGAEEQVVSALEGSTINHVRRQGVHVSPLGASVALPSNEDQLPVSIFSEPELVVGRPESLTRPMREHVYASLPPPELAATLIQAFLDNTAYHLHVVDTVSLVRELEQFEAARAAGELVRVSMSWLARTLAMYASAADSLTQEDSDLLNLTTAQVRSRVIDWVEASKVALDLAQWMSRPQLWSIQCIIIFESTLHSHPSEQGSLYSPYLPYLFAAIRLAQQLDFDRLDKAATIYPKDDPGLPKNKAHARQMGCLIWWQLVFIDAIRDYGCPASARYLKIDATAFSTPPPLSCNDSDWRLGGRLTGGHTDMTPILIRVAIVNMLAKHGEVMKTYAQAVAAEQQIRQDFDAIGALCASKQHPHAEHVSTIILNQRVMVLHRPFMIRSFTEVEYEPSLFKCMTAARAVIAAHGAIYHKRIATVCHLFSFTFSACIILAVIVVQMSSSSGVGSDDRFVLKADLDLGQKILQRGLLGNNSRQRQMCAQGLLVLETLLQTKPSDTADGHGRRQLLSLLNDVWGKVRAKMDGSTPPNGEQNGQLQLATDLASFAHQPTPLEDLDWNRIIAEFELLPLLPEGDLSFPPYYI